MNSLLYLNKYFLKYKYSFLLGILFVAISNLFGVYAPKIVREAFDSVAVNLTKYQSLNGIEAKSAFKSIFIQSLLFLAITYIALALLKGVFMFFMRQTLIVMSRLIENDLKNEIFDHYQKLNLSFYRNNNTGDLMNRISEDVSRVRMYFGPAIMYTINLVVLFILVISAMINVNAKLTFYVLIPLPFLSLGIYYVSSVINKKSEAVQRQLSVLSTWCQEAFSGIRVLKAYNRESFSWNKFDTECEKYKDHSVELIKTQALFFPFMMMLIGLSTLITVYVGGKQAIAGEVSIGNIAEFVIYVNMLTWPVATVGWVTSIIQRAAASQKRINEFLKTEPEITNTSDKLDEISGKIEFKNVNFNFENSGIHALKNISFKINPGKTLAIIGKTGSGKSTISNLLLRLMDVNEGELLIDDVNIKDLNLYNLRSNIGYVPQEVFLFSDTISQNIAFGKKTGSFDMEMIEQAAKDAAIHQNIVNFKDKYETVLGERGITLSGGQKQRISIARAIIKNPKILIFDDCLSAVDTQTEEEILNNLKRIMSGKTTILISHRVSTVQHADEIIVLKEGEIIEKGTHQELLHLNGLYFNLYEKQLLEAQEN